MNEITSMPVDVKEMLETCEKQLFWGGRIEFSDCGVRRLMCAVFLRSVRDVYSQDVIDRQQARAWLKANAVTFMHTFNIKLAHERICEWIRNDFPNEMVDMNFHNYYRKDADNGEE